MNLRAPQTLVRIDVTHATKDALIQQQSLDPRVPPPDSRCKFSGTDFQRVGAKGDQLFCKWRGREISYAPESPWVGIPQLAAVIQQQPNVRVLGAWLCGGVGREPSGHAQMHEQGRSCRVTVSRKVYAAAQGLRQTQQHEFSVALDRIDPPSRKMLL